MLKPEQITAAQAKELMDSTDDFVLLDVRTEDEYWAGHIPGAVLIPDYELPDRAEAELPDKDKLILVYCRTGGRSGTSSRKLASMGYTNVKDFGALSDWKYEMEW